MTFDGRVNLVAYDDVEAPSNYLTQEDLVAYRRERLAKYAPYVRMVSALGLPEGLRVVDIGSGSSAFLYALEQAGLLKEGLGIELSATRHAFAERWRVDKAFEHVVNSRANFTDVRLDDGSFDLVSALDDTYLYLRPEDDAYPSRLFETARGALARGGCFLLDFRNDLPVVASMSTGGRTFEVDLPATNSFARAFYRQVPSEDRRTMLTESRYVARDGTEISKTEITEVCDVPALVDLLLQAGFDSVAAYGDLDLTPFRSDSPRGVIAAKVSPPEDG